MFVLKEGTSADQIGVGTTDETIGQINAFLKTKGYTIRTLEEENSYKAAIIEQEKNSFSSSVNSALKKGFGIDRNADEAYEAYITRGLEAKGSELATVKTELEELKKKRIDGNEEAGKYKKELEDLQGRYEELTKSVEEEKSKLKKEGFDMRIKGLVQGHIDSEISPNLNSALGENILKDGVDFAKSKFFSENTFDELGDVIHIKGKDGKTLLGTDGKALSLGEALSPYFANYLGEKKPNKGGGSGPKTEPPTGGKIDPKTYAIPESVTNLVDLRTHLIDVEKLDPSDAKDSATMGAVIAEAKSNDMPFE